jgi:hypothetical protein
VTGNYTFIAKTLETVLVNDSQTIAWIFNEVNNELNSFISVVKKSPFSLECLFASLSWAIS